MGNLWLVELRPPSHLTFDIWRGWNNHPPDPFEGMWSYRLKSPIKGCISHPGNAKSPCQTRKKWIPTAKRGSGHTQNSIGQFSVDSAVATFFLLSAGLNSVFASTSKFRTTKLSAPCKQIAKGERTTPEPTKNRHHVIEGKSGSRKNHNLTSIYTKCGKGMTALLFKSDHRLYRPAFQTSHHFEVKSSPKRRIFSLFSSLV